MIVNVNTTFIDSEGNVIDPEKLSDPSCNVYPNKVVKMKILGISKTEHDDILATMHVIIQIVGWKS